MPRIRMEPASAPAVGPDPAVRQAVRGPNIDTVFPGLGSIRSVRDEIDELYAVLQSGLPPSELMERIAGYSARLSELRVRITRIEDVQRQWKPVRTQEIDPTLKELANQFSIASRLISAKEFDWRMETGAR